MITATLKIFGKTFTAKGETVLEALEKLKPGLARGVSILTVESNGKKKERVLNSIATARLFNTQGIAHDVILKRTSLQFEV